VPYKILIVDDNAAIRSLLRSLIEPKSEYQVCGEAENGEIAVLKVQELNPDVVILDLQMPVMDGLTAARHIAAASPQTAMLILTMHATDQLYKLAQAAGVKAGLLINATRVAIVGQAVAPPLFDTMVVLGQERVVTRLRRAVEAFVAR